VTLLVSGILGDEVKVFSADDEGSVHLGGNDGTSQDTATDRDETGEGALLVCKSKRSAFLLITGPEALPNIVIYRTCFRDCDLDLVVAEAQVQTGLSKPRIVVYPHTDVSSLNCGLWCAESQSNIFVPSSSTLSNCL
jgi:hypothetical protein